MRVCRFIMLLALTLNLSSQAAEKNVQANAQPTGAEIGKCKDPEFFENARDTFTCDLDWDLDSCRALSLPLAGGGVGATIGTIVNEAKNARFEKAFKNYLNLRDEHRVKLRKAHQLFGVAYEINEKSGNAFDKYYNDGFDREGKYEAYKAKTDPAEFKAAEEKFLNAQENGLKLQAEAGDMATKQILPTKEKWSKKLSKVPTLREAFDRLSSLEARSIGWQVDLGRMQGRREAGARPEEYSEVAKGADGVRQQVNSARENFRSAFDQYKLKFRSQAMAKGGAIGMFVLGSLPFILQGTAAAVCSDIANQTDAQAYLKVTPGSKGCSITLENDKELELLMKKPEDRAALFDKTPVLCKALLNKYQERQDRIKKMDVRPRLIECSTNKIAAKIDVNGRSYEYTIENVAGVMRISAPMGIANGTKLEHPIKMNWSYKPEVGVLSGKGLEPVGANPAATAGRAVDLDFLGKVQAQGSEGFTPIMQLPDSNQGVMQATNSEPGVLLKQIAEQSVALKRGLPQILEACANADIGVASPSGTASDSGSEH